jgi:hypothetical protein
MSRTNPPKMRKKFKRLRSEFVLLARHPKGQIPEDKSCKQ